MAAQQLAQGPATNTADSGPQREVERLIARGRIKEAFKQAKLCFRQQESAENRRLVERTYLLRIEELVRGGMLDPAAEVARHCLEFGVTDVAILESLVLLLPRVGMSRQAAALSGRIDSPEARAGLSLKIADQAVLHPRESAAAAPDVRDGAERIRAALRALHQSQEEEAFEFLKEIPRNSPWADWRYFVRGLAAFYRRDQDQAVENWGRLDPERAASRIAAVLLRMQDAPHSKDGRPNQPKNSADLSLLEVAVYGEPLLGRLAELRGLLDPPAGISIDWQKVCQLLATLRPSLVRVDIRLAQRLTEVLLDPLIEEAIHQPLEPARLLIRKFTSAAEPLPFDPRWNRLWAILWERSECGLDSAVNYWQEYARDIERLDAIDPAEKRRLQAVVWRRIGELRVEELDAEFPDFLGGAGDRPAPQRGEAAAIQAFEQSLRLDPAQRRTYERLLELYEQREQSDAAVDVARRCLQAFPDDMEALRLLIEHHRRRDEPVEMLRHVEQARTAQRLDPRLVSDEYWARIALARQLAIGGQFDSAVAEFSRADELYPEQAHGYRMLARRAALAQKSGQTDLAEDLIRQARGKLGEPAVLWLALSIESVRYELPQRLKRQYEDALRGALAKKATSQTAGQMAEILLAYSVSKITYAGHTRHIQDAVAYFSRTTRIKYFETDLRSVCMFLLNLESGSHEDLLDSLVKKGQRLFPKSPAFYFLAVEREMKKGPFECDLYLAKRQAQKALKLVEGSTDPAEQEMAAEVKRYLLKLDDMLGMMSKLPPLGGRGPGSKMNLNPLDLLKQLMAQFGGMGADDEEDPEERFDHDDENDFFFSAPPRRASARAPRKRK
jgi:tetratricopeptide (TPR) repeat protein